MDQETKNRMKMILSALNAKDKKYTVINPR
jgi:hypothetical protein